MTARRLWIAAPIALAAWLLGAGPAAAELSFTRTDHPVTGAPTDIELGDLDGANGSDIVLATYVAGGSPDSRVVRLLNQGGGSFAAESATSSCNFGYDLVVHNFTPSADSDLDALVSCGTLQGDGAGGFTTPPVATGAPVAGALSLAELTGGGTPELVYGGQGLNNTFVLCFSTWSSPDFSAWSCGNPPPFNAQQPPAFPRFPRPFTVPVDLGNEPVGEPARDVVLTESLEANAINFYGRDPATGYNSWTATTRTTSAGSVAAVAAGDVDGDGNADVAVAHGIDADPRFDLFRSDPAGGIRAGAPTQVPTIMRAEQIAVRDLDGDGDADVTLANGLGQVAVHRGLGDGSFAQPQTFALPGNNTNVHMAVGDLSGDGLADIAVADRSGHSVSVLINTSVPPAPDTTPPETTITRGPPQQTTKRRVTFRFAANELGAAFSCKLDGGPYKPCASPWSRRVGTGKHTFRVRATDPAGNADPTPATQVWRVINK